MKDDFFEAFIKGMIDQGATPYDISRHIVKALERKEMGRNKMCALCQLSPRFSDFLEKRAEIYSNEGET